MREEREASSVEDGKLLNSNPFYEVSQHDTGGNLELIAGDEGMSLCNAV
jgi:hypothetical protein